MSNKKVKHDFVTFVYYVWGRTENREQWLVMKTTFGRKESRLTSFLYFWSVNHSFLLQMVRFKDLLTNEMNKLFKSLFCPSWTRKVRNYKLFSCYWKRLLWQMCPHRNLWQYSILSSLSIFVLLLKSEKISNYPIRCMMFQYFNISSFKFSSSLDIFQRFA